MRQQFSEFVYIFSAASLLIFLEGGQIKVSEFMNIRAQFCTQRDLKCKNHLLTFILRYICVSVWKYRLWTELTLIKNVLLNSVISEAHKIYKFLRTFSYCIYLYSVFFIKVNFISMHAVLFLKTTNSKLCRILFWVKYWSLLKDLLGLNQNSTRWSTGVAFLELANSLLGQHLVVMKIREKFLCDFLN